MSRATFARLSYRARTLGIPFLAFVSLCVLPALVSAQETGRIVGTVRAAGSGRPLETAQVYIAGTGIGTTAQSNGRYLLLNVPAGEVTLVAELVGYKSASQVVDVGAGESVVADFQLSQSAIELDELVVTGAGVATEKRKLGNTIGSIDASDLENAPISDFSQMLAAREPGVAVLPSSGYTGQGARIRIRGSSSLSQLNEPIIYVDGIRVNSGAVETYNTQGQPSRLDDIPPESIERIEILKGAAAATLYGTEASNGVIQIFTKKGRAGAPRWSFESEWTAINAPTSQILPVADFAARACDEPGCTGEDDAETLAETQAQIASMWGQNVGPYEVFQENLIPELLSTGFGQIYSATVQGGSDVFQYFVSGRYADEDGPFEASKAFPAAPNLDPEDDTNRRATIQTNFTIIPSEKFRIGVSSFYTDMEHHTPDNANNIYGVFSSSLMTQLRLASENNLWGAPAFGTTREAMFQQNFVNSSHFAGSTTLSYTPTQDFRLDGTFGLDFTSDDAVAFRPYRWNVDGFSGSTPTGNRTVSEERSREITADLKASWGTRFSNMENTLLAGAQGFLRQSQFAGGGGSEFPGPGLETLSALAEESSFESWTRNTQVGVYLQDQFGWNDWVFTTLGGRWDANSAFGEDFSTAFYPKASISIVPTQGITGFGGETLSTLRLRAAIGESGLQPSAFAKFTTYSPAPSEEGPGVAPSNLGNDGLEPEVSRELEFGTEIGLFNDRASLDLTWWDKTTSDALVSKQFPVTGGFTSRQLVNIGELQANGFDITARGTVVQGEGFSLNVFANGAYISEEITDLGGAPPIKTGGSYPRYRNWLIEGYAPASFFGAKLASDLEIPLNIIEPAADGSCVIPTRQQALDYFSTPRDPSSFKPLAVGNDGFGSPNGGVASNNCGDGLLESYLGKPTADWQGSFGFDIAFLDNFEISSLFEFKAGDFVTQDLSGEFRRANSVIGRNTPRASQLYAIMLDPASSAEQRLDAAVAWAKEVEALAPMSGLNSVFNSNYVRWRELSLTYRLPTEFMSSLGFDSGTLNLGIRNLKLWVNGDYPGMDPEGNVYGRCNGGTDCNFINSTEGWGVPIPRRISISTRVTF
ncbi:MAG: SusC/RagA family TonB-linked outer membrane protein [Gemmatimonadota bacterium]|jgi:TonB-linked SusC/RagA family outer membrane protein